MTHDQKLDEAGVREGLSQLSRHAPRFDRSLAPRQQAKSTRFAKGTAALAAFGLVTFGAVQVLGNDNEQTPVAATADVPDARGVSSSVPDLPVEEMEAKYMVAASSLEDLAEFPVIVGEITDVRIEVDQPAPDVRNEFHIFTVRVNEQLAGPSVGSDSIELVAQYETDGSGIVADGAPWLTSGDVFMASVMENANDLAPWTIAGPWSLFEIENSELVLPQRVEAPQARTAAGDSVVDEHDHSDERPDYVDELAGLSIGELRTTFS